MAGALVLGVDTLSVVIQSLYLADASRCCRIQLRAEDGAVLLQLWRWQRHVRQPVAAAPVAVERCACTARAAELPRPAGRIPSQVLFIGNISLTSVALVSEGRVSGALRAELTAGACMESPENRPTVMAAVRPPRRRRRRRTVTGRAGVGTRFCCLIAVGNLQRYNNSPSLGLRVWEDQRRRGPAVTVCGEGGRLAARGERVTRRLEQCCPSGVCASVWRWRGSPRLPTGSAGQVTTRDDGSRAIGAAGREPTATRQHCDRPPTRTVMKIRC